MLYTDGSGINKKVGTAAVHPPSKTVHRMYLGGTDWFTVYSAELHGIVLALSLVYHHRREWLTGSRTVVINTDNQASIQAIEDPKKHSGQTWVIQAIQLINTLRNESIFIELHWIPAHIELDGNEWADKEAKEATGWREKWNHGQIIEIDTDDTATRSPTQVRMIATVKTAIKAYAHNQWAKEWKDDTKGSALRRAYPTPSHSIKRIHKQVKRAKSSLITQIRTEKIGPKAFLYNRWVPGVEEESCECGADKQTARHILHECRLFNRQRREWWAKERRKTLGGVISHMDMLNNPCYISMAADFIKNTGLIGQFRALDIDQQQGFRKANGQTTGCGDDEEAPAM